MSQLGLQIVIVALCISTFVSGLKRGCLFLFFLKSQNHLVQGDVE